MTAIEFENISKQYRLGLVNTGTHNQNPIRFWQTKILLCEDPYPKVGNYPKDNPRKQPLAHKKNIKEKTTQN